MASVPVPSDALLVSGFYGRDVWSLQKPHLVHFTGEDAQSHLPASLQRLALFRELTQEQWQQCVYMLNEAAGRTHARGHFTLASLVAVVIILAIEIAATVIVRAQVRDAYHGDAHPTKSQEQDGVREPGKGYTPARGYTHNRSSADSANARLYGMAWLSTVLMIVVMVASCLCAVPLIRRWFVKRWRRNDAEMRAMCQQLSAWHPRLHFMQSAHYGGPCARTMLIRYVHVVPAYVLPEYGAASSTANGVVAAQGVPVTHAFAVVPNFFSNSDERDEYMRSSASATGHAGGKGSAKAAAAGVLPDSVVAMGSVAAAPAAAAEATAAAAAQAQAPSQPAGTLPSPQAVRAHQAPVSDAHSPLRRDERGQPEDASPPPDARAHIVATDGGRVSAGAARPTSQPHRRDAGSSRAVQPSLSASHLQPTSAPQAGVNEVAWHEMVALEGRPVRNLATPTASPGRSQSAAGHATHAAAGQVA